MKFLSIVFSLLMFVSCDSSDDAAPAVVTDKIVFSVDCATAECQTAAADGKSYYFAVMPKVEDGECLQVFDIAGGEPYLVLEGSYTYATSSEDTSETVSCDALDGCVFSTEGVVYDADGEKMTTVTAGTYDAAVLIDMDDDGALSDGDYFECFENEEAVTLATGTNTIKFRSPDPVNFD